MKFLHFIALLKTNNLKIAYDFVSDDVAKIERQRQKFIEKMDTSKIDILYNFHFVPLNSSKVEFLVQYDSYFSQFNFVTLDKFYDLAIKELSRHPQTFGL